MKLISLRLTNFRQFKSAYVEFADGDSGKVTIIHGENTQGKSALLAAFRWVLHGYSGIINSITHPNVLVNREEFEVNSDASASVELMFTTSSSEGVFHVAAIRTLAARLQGSHIHHDGIVKVSITNRTTGEGTQTLKDADATAFLRSVIPFPLLDLLFYSGEGIDKLTSSVTAGIGGAVRAVLGFNVLEEAIQNLSQAKAKFEDTLHKSADEQLKKKIDQNNKLISERDLNLEKKKDFEKRLLELSTEALNSSKELETYAEVKDLASDQTRYLTSIESDRSRLAAASGELKEFIKNNAFTIVSRRASVEGSRLELALRQSGDFPSAVSKRFLDELVQANACICGRPLEPGSHEHAKVTSLRSSRARGEEFHEAAESISFFLKEASDKHAERVARLEYLKNECLVIRARIESNLVELADVQDRIENSPVDSIIEIQAKIARVHDEIGGLKESVLTANREMFRLEPVIQKLSKEIIALSVKRDETRIAQKRIDFINDAISELQLVIDKGTDIMHQKLNELVAEYFMKYNNVDGFAKIERINRGSGLADDFRPVPLIRNSKGEWIEETGANRAKQQCLSLAYIRSVLSVASRLDEVATGGARILASESYPLVLDAPFGVFGGSGDAGPAASVCSSFTEFEGQTICFINYANYLLLKKTLDDDSYVTKRFYIQSFVASGPVNHDLFGKNIDVFSLFPPGGAVAQLYSEIKPI